MAATSTFIGFFAAVSLATTLFYIGRVMPTFVEAMSAGFSTNSAGFTTNSSSSSMMASVIYFTRNSIGNDFVIGVSALLALSVPIVNSRWNFLRFLAEAQATVALSEIADGELGRPSGNLVPTGTTPLLAICTWILPATAMFMLCIGFLALVSTPRSLSLELIDVEDTDISLVKLSAPLHKFTNVDIEFELAATNVRFWGPTYSLENDLEYFVCPGRYIQFSKEFAGLGSFEVRQKGHELNAPPTAVVGEVTDIFEAPVVVVPDEPDYDSVNIDFQSLSVDGEPVDLVIDWRTISGRTGTTTTRLTKTVISQQEHLDLVSSNFRWICDLG